MLVAAFALVLIAGAAAANSGKGLSKEDKAALAQAAANNVYVDANQDHSFADQPAMTDYKTNYDVGTFGTDNPATAVRETVPFVVQTDGQNKVVNIGIVSRAHGTHVAGIAAGKNLFGGTFDGAAPEAQIVSIRVCLFIAGCTSHALIEGMIYAEKQAAVDVINMSIGGLPALGVRLLSESSRRPLEGPRRSVRGPRREHRVRLCRRGRQPGLRLGDRHGSIHVAQPR